MAISPSSFFIHLSSILIHLFFIRPQSLLSVFLSISPHFISIFSPPLLRSPSVSPPLFFSLSIASTSPSSFPISRSQCSPHSSLLLQPLLQALLTTLYIESRLGLPVSITFLFIIVPFPRCVALIARFIPRLSVHRSTSSFHCFTITRLNNLDPCVNKFCTN